MVMINAICVTASFMKNMKMTQFDKKNAEGRAIVNDVSSVITALIMTK